MERKRVLVSDKLSKQGLEVFEAAHDQIELVVKTGMSKPELLEVIPEFDALVVRSATTVDKEVLAKAKKLKVVGRAGIGVDNIDVEEASRAGVIVMNTPEGNVVTTAEHAIALMTSLARKIPQATASMKDKKWEKSKFQGRELYQKTLGIVGLGNIGKIVADRALGLRMKVVAFDPFVTNDKAKELGVDLLPLDGLLERSDFVTLHVPLNDGTRGIIDRAAIEKMKPGAFLINAARGGLVDEAAVADAVASGRLAGAAFDVYEEEPPAKDNPLLSVDNVILSPHLGASTEEAQENVARDVAVQIIDLLTTGAVRNAINAPSLSAELREIVGPWMGVGRRVGALAGQLHQGGLKRVQIVYEGQVAEHPTSPIGISVLCGLLSSRLDHVNEVNAQIVAKERGIEIIASKTSTPGDFASQVKLAVEGDQGTTSVTGTLVGHREARIVEVNGVRLEIVPHGNVLFTEHYDKPGMIGRIGSVLGQNQLNISRLVLAAPNEDGGYAKSAISIDGPATENVLGQIKEIDGIKDVRSIRFS